MFKTALLSRTPVPERIRNAPELYPWLYEVYEAFFELLSCLTPDGRIPWDAIAQYASVMGLAQTPSELASFVGLIRGMEKTYSDHRKIEMDKTNKEPKKPKGGIRGSK